MAVLSTPRPLWTRGQRKYIICCSLTLRSVRAAPAAVCSWSPVSPQWLQPGPVPGNMGLPFYHGKQYLNNRNHTAVVIEWLWVLELERKKYLGSALNSATCWPWTLQQNHSPSTLLSPSIKWVYLLHTDVD